MPTDHWVKVKVKMKVKESKILNKYLDDLGRELKNLWNMSELYQS